VRWLAGLLAVALVALPVVTAPVPIVAGMGAAAGLLCLAGIVRLSIRFLTAGAAGAVIQYALVLWISSAPPDFLTVVVLGVVLGLLLDVVEFAARFQGVAVDRQVLQRQAREWLGWAAIGGSAGLVLAGAAGRVALGLPAWAYTSVAAFGALVAFGAVVRLLAGAHVRPLDAAAHDTE
jgi:hypothetical protein